MFGNKKGNGVWFLLAALLLLGLFAGGSLASAQGNSSLRQDIHRETGVLNFLGADPRSPIAISGAMAPGLAAEDRAMAVMSVYGEDFGLLNPASELSLMRSRDLADGRTSTRFQQVYQGIPVLAGELMVNLDSRGRLLSINGEISPDLDLSVTAEVSADQALNTAMGLVSRQYGVSTSQLQAADPALWVFDERLLRPSGRPAELVWRTEVTTIDLMPIRELVLINAHRGGVSLHFNQVDTVLNRTIYDNNNDDSLGLPGGGPFRTEGDPPYSVVDVNDAYDFSGDTYDFFMASHGRDSIDNAGMGLISTTRYCHPLYSCPFANAFWNGTQMVYGQGYASGDDVVGHELTHGVTENESGLFYYYQSGAINESLSDVWGEFVDLSNGVGSDGPADRWLLGEDIPIGAIRDMEHPPNYNDPDRMGSGFYYTGSADSGGVHTNSGVNNKAAFLMTDGGSFNGKTVSPLGMEKVADIYYEAQTNLLVSGSDYLDLYNLLYQACLNLVGTGGITSGDCQEVRDATDAVEMNQEPAVGYNPEATVCSPGLTQVPLFSDNLESGPGNFSFAATTGTNRWQYDSPYGPFAHSGMHFLYADDFPTAFTDTTASMNMDVTLPPGSQPYLRFDHAFGFEDPNYDGGVLEYSTNGGGSWMDAGGLHDSGKGYGGTIASGYGNPLAGRSAFISDSHGYVSSRYALSSLAGNNVRFRWRMGIDDIIYDWGWWVDDVVIYQCLLLDQEIYLPLISR